MISRCSLYVAGWVLSGGLELKMACPACPGRMSVEPHLSAAQWQLPFHLGSPMFNCPHYVINLANLPLALKAQLWTLADHKPSQSHSITGKSTLSAFAFRPAITFPPGSSLLSLLVPHSPPLLLRAEALVCLYWPFDLRERNKHGAVHSRMISNISLLP